MVAAGYQERHDEAQKKNQQSEDLDAWEKTQRVLTAAATFALGSGASWWQTVVMFTFIGLGLAFPFLLPRLGFWPSLGLCIVLTGICFAGFALLLKPWGIDLLDL